MLNQRKKKTFYGAVNYYTRETVVKEYEGGDSKNTVDFVEYLRMKSGFKNILLIWDGASYHKNGEMKSYLEKINKGYEENFRVACMLFAPNAPEQNPMEDVWNIAKRHLRKNFSDFFSFNDVIKSFGDFIDTHCFNFPKLHLYGEI